MPFKVLAALAVTLLFWGSAFVGIRAGLESYAPGHLALLRFLVASAVLGSYAAYKGVRLPRFRDIPVLMVHGFLGYTVYHACLNYGEQTVSAGGASFIISTIPVFSILLAVVFLKERIGLRSIAGILVSMAGVTLISFGEGGGFSFNAGALLILLAAFSESLYIVLQKPFLSRYTPLEYVTYTLTAGTLFLLFYAPGLGQAVAAAPLHDTLAVVYLGVCPAAVAYVTWSYALSQGDVSRIVVSQYCLPAIAIVIGVIWLGELPTLISVFGGLMALGGVALITGRKTSG